MLCSESSPKSPMTTARLCSISFFAPLRSQEFLPGTPTSFALQGLALLPNSVHNSDLNRLTVSLESNSTWNALGASVSLPSPGLFGAFQRVSPAHPLGTRLKV